MDLIGVGTLQRYYLDRLSFETSYPFDDRPSADRGSEPPKATGTSMTTTYNDRQGLLFRDTPFRPAVS